MTPSVRPHSPQGPRPKTPGEHGRGHQQISQWLRRTPLSGYSICSTGCKLGTGGCDTLTQVCKACTRRWARRDDLHRGLHPVPLDLVDLHRGWLSPCSPQCFACTNPPPPLLGKLTTVPGCLPHKTNSKIRGSVGCLYFQHGNALGSKVLLDEYFCKKILAPVTFLPLGIWFS